MSAAEGRDRTLLSEALDVTRAPHEPQPGEDEARIRLSISFSRVRMFLWILLWVLVAALVTAGVLTWWVVLR